MEKLFDCIQEMHGLKLGLNERFTDGVLVIEVPAASYPQASEQLYALFQSIMPDLRFAVLPSGINCTVFCDRERSA